MFGIDSYCITLPGCPSYIDNIKMSFSLLSQLVKRNIFSTCLLMYVTDDFWTSCEGTNIHFVVCKYGNTPEHRTVKLAELIGNVVLLTIEGKRKS